jgi:hypothetical protein
MQQQQQQQQPAAVTVEAARPVLARNSRLENDSPNAPASAAAAKRVVRPASATPALSVLKAPAPSRLPPPISSTPRSGKCAARIAAPIPPYFLTVCLLQQLQLCRKLAAGGEPALSK